jgi:hypothetical protein
MLTPAESGPSRSSTPNKSNGNKQGKPKADWKVAKAAPLVSYDSDSSIDPDTMVPEWLDMQTKLYSLQPDLFNRPGKGKKGRGPAASQSVDPEVAKLQRKIAKVENDVLFERREAEYIWKDKLEELRKDATFIRRPPERKKEEPPAEEQPAMPALDGLDLSMPSMDELDGAGLGDMFQEQTESSGSSLGLPVPTAGSTTILRDFGKTMGRQSSTSTGRDL